jgi:hypothetical protein
MRNPFAAGYEKEIEKMVSAYLSINPNTERNLLFLDFDGVINGPGFHVETHKEGMFQKTVELYHALSVNNLNSIAIEFKTDIVISSSWRHMGLQYCKDYLHQCGLETSISIIGTTGRDYPYQRWKEILEWLRKNPEFTNFAIIDDLEMNALSRWHVRTSFNSGLTDEKAEEVRRIYRRGLID